ncbi:hypothetical protein KPSA3_00594 [Pseudomonas syringae pv. actinidiae]|uniref:Uncharacterized protein n=1 Tax=Pseudomonas syringae pv. actinidiae TaxID=103796 RepID=A0AAN4TII5_PSESF|nr:hypothetical protein KPSA3_00594 [Pseudomonas syringae pv. actinidiae]
MQTDFQCAPLRLLGGLPVDNRLRRLLALTLITQRLCGQLQAVTRRLPLPGTPCAQPRTQHECQDQEAHIQHFHGSTSSAR